MYELIYSLPSPLHPHVFCPFPPINICLVTFEVALIEGKICKAHCGLCLVFILMNHSCVELTEALSNGSWGDLMWTRLKCHPTLQSHITVVSLFHSSNRGVSLIHLFLSYTNEKQTYDELCDCQREECSPCWFMRVDWWTLQQLIFAAGRLFNLNSFIW